MIDALLAVLMNGHSGISLTLEDLPFLTRDALNSQERVSALPQPDNTPPPEDNKPVPGGGLDPQAMSCSGGDMPLRALIPRALKLEEEPFASPLYSIADEPTILLHVPEKTSAIRSISFSLLDKSHRKRFYKESFELPESEGGMVSLRIPLSVRKELKNSEFYQWYIEFDCANSESEDNDIYLNGWIYLVQSTLERKNLVNRFDKRIWYDVATKVFKMLLSKPEDEQVRNLWQGILENIEMEDEERDLINSSQFIAPLQ